MNLKNGKVFTSKFVVTGPRLMKKNLPGRGLTKVENTALDSANAGIGVPNNTNSTTQYLQRSFAILLLALLRDMHISGASR